MQRTKTISRRRALRMTAAAAALPLVHVRTAGAAGTLSMGVWDHWVKQANPVLQGLIGGWAAKNKVEVKLDLITSTGSKIVLTQAAEAQARAGHDIMAFDQWNTQQYADKLTPVDDVMNGLVKQYGPTSKAIEYLAKKDGHWMGVPVAWGTAPLPACARISLLRKHAGVDVTKWYPAHAAKASDAAEWTYDKQLEIARQCHAAGVPLALGCGSNSTDANQTWGATFGAFGADLMNARGDITVDSDPVREVLDYVKRIGQYLPPEAPIYDDASNNKALISGKTALIWNPPSAWSVARHNAPEIAADCWTFPNPKGKMGRLVPHRPYTWGIWKWSRNAAAAKDLMSFLSQRENVEKLSVPAVGYDIPPFLSMSDLPIWAEVEPPKGTIFNYPVRPWHDAEYYIPGSSAPPDLATQIWGRSVIPQMVARIIRGDSAKEVIAWASQELEGFRR